MEKQNEFLSLFKSNKPIIGMLHLKGYDEADILLRALREIDIYMRNGIDAVIIENYFGDIKSVDCVLSYLSNYHKDIIYGINILGNYRKAFELVDKYKAKFIQIDSVAGHLVYEDDKIFEHDLNLLRKQSPVKLIGGVRFKYQPYLSDRPLNEDLKIGMSRCDGIVVTGSGTGKETDLEKIIAFRNIIGNFPLIVGAGLTARNCVNQLAIADAGIVGSYLKVGHIDSGDVCNQNTKEFMEKVKTYRR
jgi:hypothetical protein